MLITSIFFFSHIAFYSIKERNRHFSNILFILCECFQISMFKNLLSNKGLIYLQDVTLQAGYHIIIE